MQQNAVAADPKIAMAQLADCGSGEFHAPRGMFYDEVVVAEGVVFGKGFW
jgi:hypothetical protein